MLPSAVPHNATKTLRLRLRLNRSAWSPARQLLPVSPSRLDPIAGRRWTHSTIDSAAQWRDPHALDQWVAKEARPISLRQLSFFGRSLTEERLISSANYVRTELPTRISHRIRDMQRLPYVVVTNRHMSEVYNLYYTAFDTFRRVKEIKTLKDNDDFCSVISGMLRAHLSVIPKLAMGMVECNELMPTTELDRFMNTILRSRISRRVIAEQHLALTETFNSDWFSPGAKLSEHDFIGEVFLKCVAKDVVESCGRAAQDLARSAYGPDVAVPEIKIDGYLNVTFPYILSHLQYIVGELLRNSIQAVMEKHRKKGNGNGEKPPPPIEVTLCEAQQHVVIRISDRGGGIARDTLPYLWSFGQGPGTDQRLQNLGQVPLMAATLQELRFAEGNLTLGLQEQDIFPDTTQNKLESKYHKAEGGSSLTTLSTRPPNLRLGISLPLSRVYAEYWAGTLELHNLEGYGVDAFLQISKLGNKNEQLATRAMMDAV